MINKNKLEDKLTERFIMYQWRLENPMPTKEEFYLRENISMHPSELHYRTDNIFRLKVRSLVVAIMQTVDECLEYE